MYKNIRKELISDIKCIEEHSSGFYKTDALCHTEKTGTKATCVPALRQMNEFMVAVLFKLKTL